MAGMTAGGVPYPLGTDRLADGAGTIEALARFLDAAQNTRCKVQHTAAVSLPNGASTAIPMQTEDVDPTGMHAGTSSRVTIAKPGRYLIVGALAFAGNNTGYRQASIGVNGAGNRAIVRQNTVTGSTPHFMQVVLSTLLVAGDYVELLGVQNCGAALDSYPGAVNTWLDVSWVGAV